MNKIVVKHNGKIIGELSCEFIPHLESPNEFIRLFVEAPTEIEVLEGNFEDFKKASMCAALAIQRNPKCVLLNT